MALFNVDEPPWGAVAWVLDEIDRILALRLCPRCMTLSLSFCSDMATEVGVFVYDEEGQRKDEEDRVG
jgi:hypothetical protein